MRFAAAFLLLALPGCGLAEPADAETLDRETFVRVYVELREAASAVGDSAEFTARKQKILSRYETTPEELERFIGAHAGEVGYLTALWDTINQRLISSDEDTASD